MVLAFKFKSNSAAVQNKMAKLALKQVPISVAKALTFTAKILQDQNVRDMPTLFDNPTGWTKNARTSQQHYLKVQQTGGGKPSKAFETAIQARGIRAQKFRYATPTSRQSTGKFGNVTKS